MWNERFLFVYSALFAIAIWAVVGLRRKEIRAKRRTHRVALWSGLVLTSAAILLIAHVSFYLSDYLKDYWNEPSWARLATFLGAMLPRLGSVLAILVGAVVGTFTARFVWSLFGTNFGRKDPLIGASVLLVLIIVYSLPTYQGGMSALLGRVGSASVKTPVVELSFTQQSQFRNAVASASKATGDERSSAIPRPTYPNPALDDLKDVVSDGYFAREDRYIAFLLGKPIPPGPALENAALTATQKFIRPAKALSVCLQAYVKIFPDSQLLLVDMKPLLQWFFRMHARARKAVKDGPAEEPWQDALDLGVAVGEVRDNVLKAIDLLPGGGTLPVAENDPSKTFVRRSLIRRFTVGDPKSAFAQGRLVKDNELREKLEKLGYERQEIKDFLESCGERFDKTSREDGNHPETISYLQPYVTIALAKLLVAHGSSDAAIYVLTQWLDLWRCARSSSLGVGMPISANGQNATSRPGKRTSGSNDNSKPGARDTSPTDGKLVACRHVPNSMELPEWFSIRAEFELNVLLYKIAGEGNIVYREFLEDHARHFENVVLRAPTDRGVSLSIRSELARCLGSENLFSRKSNGSNSTVQEEVRAALLRSLLQNEDTLLRSEIHFLSELKWADMENLYERALALTRFRIDCIYPENARERRSSDEQLVSNAINEQQLSDAIKKRQFWEATLANYSITAGLLGLSISEKLANTADSADERARAEEINNQAKTQLRYGYRSLKPHVRRERDEFKKGPWADRVFNVSAWEQSYSLAERALYRLGAPSH
jgi:hypothetical protein